MASYRIVLNLSGNATRNVEKLIDVLQRAKDAAEGLNESLGETRVGAPVRGGGGQRGGRGVIGNLNRLAGTIGAMKTLGMAAIQGAYLSVGAGFVGLRAGASYLSSGNAEAGIRMLQRQAQARAGFGPQYGIASRRAEELSAAFGLNPANVIASMNVLTGMQLGRSGRRLSLGEAERLTQAGGIIAQQGGRSFEMVMTNLQQMMSQVTPNMRDIRELLNAAPILSKYAMDEIAKEGRTGVSAMDWLRDQNNMLRVLDRYLAENPPIAGMRARGIIERSNLEFNAALAGNPAWLGLAMKYESSMGNLADNLNPVFSMVSSSQLFSFAVKTFDSSVSKITMAFDWFGKLFGSGVFLSMVDTFLVPGVFKGEGYRNRIQEVEKEESLRKYLSLTIGDVRESLSGTPKALPTDDAEAVAEVFRRLSNADKLYDFVVPYGMTKHEWRSGGGAKYPGYTWDTYKGLVESQVKSSPLTSGLSLSKIGFGLDNASGVLAYQVKKNELLDWLKRPEDIDGASTFKQFNGQSTLDQMNGSDISGFGRDRKALTINFNAPIVDWDSNITTGDPQDVVNEVSETIEGAASRAIQIALLGASQKMTTRF